MAISQTCTSVSKIPFAMIPLSNFVFFFYCPVWSTSSIMPCHAMPKFCTTGQNQQTLTNMQCTFSRYSISNAKTKKSQKHKNTTNCLSCNFLPTNFTQAHCTFLQTFLRYHVLFHIDSIPGTCDMRDICGRAEIYAGRGLFPSVAIPFFFFFFSPLPYQCKIMYCDLICTSLRRIPIRKHPRLFSANQRTSYAPIRTPSWTCSYSCVHTTLSPIPSRVT